METSPDNDTSSPASSPSGSVFSYDIASSQSSVTSASSNSAERVWDSDDGFSAYANPPQLPPTGVRHELARVESHAGAFGSDFESIQWRYLEESISVLESQQVLPTSARRNPRRTQPQSGVRSQDGSLGTKKHRPPPSLVRQDVRKDNFVDGLVGEQYSDSAGPRVNANLIPPGRHHNTDY